MMALTLVLSPSSIHRSIMDLFDFSTLFHPATCSQDRNLIGIALKQSRSRYKTLKIESKPCLSIQILIEEPKGPFPSIIGGFRSVAFLGVVEESVRCTWISFDVESFPVSGQCLLQKVDV